VPPCPWAVAVVHTPAQAHAAANRMSSLRTANLLPIMELDCAREARQRTAARLEKKHSVTIISSHSGRVLTLAP
jgi:hypothetical protein